MLSPNFNVQNNLREEFELPLDVIIIPGILFPCHSCHSLFNINNTLVEESNVKRMPKKIIRSQSYYDHLSHFILYITMFIHTC